MILLAMELCIDTKRLFIVDVTFDVRVWASYEIIVVALDKVS